MVRGACSPDIGKHCAPQLVAAAAESLRNWLAPFYSLVGVLGRFQKPEDAHLLPALNYSVLYILVAVLLFVFMKYFIDSNNTSFHRYYRDRLRSCFFRNETTDQQKTGAIPVDPPHISELRHTDGPYLLVNCTLNAKVKHNSESTSVDLPFVIGCNHTGNDVAKYVDTKSLEIAVGQNFDLPTIAAISGAVFSPAMGHYTIPSFRLIMAVLAFRLGYWIPNPARIALTRPLISSKGWSGSVLQTWRSPGRRVGALYFLREMFGSLSARSRFLYVTDGGHTDNSGIFELLRRRCTTIIAIDAEADPEKLYDNIAYLIELARVRLNVEIALRCTSVGSDGGAHCAIGEIRYPANNGSPPVRGTLVYCKLCLTGDENWDLLCRRSASGEIPFHSTLNQNYDELLFNAYEILGTHALGRAISGEDRVEFPNGEIRPLLSEEIRMLFSAA